MEYKHNIFTEINNCLYEESQIKLEEYFNILFNGKSQYNIYSKVYPKNTHPIEIYLFDLGKKPLISSDQIDSGIGTWYQSDSGYGCRIHLSSLTDRDFFQQIRDKIKNFGGVGVNLWYGGQYNVLWFEDSKIYRYEPFREPGSYHQRNIDGGLCAYFSENASTFKYHGHYLQNLKLNINLKIGTILSPSYCILYLQKRIQEKYKTHLEAVIKLNGETDDIILSSLKNLWYFLMVKCDEYET